MPDHCSPYLDTTARSLADLRETILANIGMHERMLREGLNVSWHERKLRERQLALAKVEAEIAARK